MAGTLFKSDMPTRKQIAAKRKRAEAAVIKAVRAECAERDGPCRVMSIHGSPNGYCGGVPEWAHLGEWKRSKTRGMAPEERHHTRGSLMLCTRHHRMYGAGEFNLTYGPDGANGALTVVRKAS